MIVSIQEKGIPSPLSHLLHLARGVKTAGEMLMTDSTVTKLREKGYIGQTSDGIYFLERKGIETLYDIGLLHE